MIQKTANRLDSTSWEPPILQGLTQVDFFKDLFSTPAFAEEPQKEILGFGARILKKHLRKTVIDYTLTFPGSTKRYIGIYREADERLRYTYTVLKTLRENGFARPSHLRVPRPILYMPALSFLLMDKANGEPLREILLRENSPGPYLVGAAEWLAKLHTSRIRLEQSSSRTDEVQASLRYTRALDWHFPQLKSKIDTLSDQLVKLQEANPPPPRKPIHGDYHPRNIISSPTATSVIDLEEARMGDPAFDVGYFVAQMKMTHGTIGPIADATELFVQAYIQKQTIISDDFLQRIAVFEAQTYFQRIYHTYYLLQLKPDFDKITDWLNVCKTRLDKASTMVQ